MNVLDWVFIFVIAAASIYGLIKGLIKALAMFLGLFLGFILASRFYENLGPLLQDLGLGVKVSKILALIVLWLAIFVGFVLLGIIIHRIVQAISLGWLNRLAGMALGFVKGITISSLIILVLTFALSEKAPLLRQSQLSPYIMEVSKLLLSLAPEDLKNLFFDQ